MPSRKSIKELVQSAEREIIEAQETNNIEQYQQASQSLKHAENIIYEQGKSEIKSSRDLFHAKEHLKHLREAHEANDYS